MFVERTWWNRSSASKRIQIESRPAPKVRASRSSSRSRISSTDSAERNESVTSSHFVR